MFNQIQAIVWQQKLAFVTPAAMKFPYKQESD